MCPGVPAACPPHSSPPPLQKERDFYFGKLRDIEILLQSYAGADRPTVDTIFRILYATEDDFVQPPPQQPQQGGGGQVGSVVSPKRPPPGVPAAGGGNTPRDQQQEQVVRDGGASAAGALSPGRAAAEATYGADDFEDQ